MSKKLTIINPQSGHMGFHWIKTFFHIDFKWTNDDQTVEYFKPVYGIFNKKII